MLAAEVLTLLEQDIPTEAELNRRQSLLDTARRIRTGQSASLAPPASSEEMQREDRER